MADIDSELIERAIRWCAEAGRQTTPTQVRAALGSLKWDELLAARALLADPPPTLPLGPFALADVARGAPADVAAERERAGGYAGAMADALPRVTQAPPARPRKKSRAPFVVRRASRPDSLAPVAPRPPPLLDELFLEEGRAVLSRLIRRHGGRRAHIHADLAAGWRRSDGQPLLQEDLDRLLVHHGLARGFETRERDEILHALRAAGGVLGKAAAQVGLDRPGFEAALERLRARPDAERLRERRRRALRARGTLTQRTHLILDEGEQLADLGLLDEFVQDLRERLPDHLRALGTGPFESVADGLCRSLTLDPRGVERLAHVTGLRLDATPPRTPGPARRPPASRSSGSSTRQGGERPSTSRSRGPRSPSPRPFSPRPDSVRPPVSRPGRPPTGGGSSGRGRPEGPKRPGAGGRGGRTGRPPPRGR